MRQVPNQLAAPGGIEAATRGIPERRVLEIVAGKVAARLATATEEQHRFHLSRDLEMVRRRIEEIDRGG